jgi:hypothetical protein
MLGKRRTIGQSDKFFKNGAPETKINSKGMVNQNE